MLGDWEIGNGRDRHCSRHKKEEHRQLEQELS